MTLRQPLNLRVVISIPNNNEKKRSERILLLVFIVLLSIFAVTLGDGKAKLFSVDLSSQ